MGTVPLGMVQLAAGRVAQEIGFCFISSLEGRDYFRGERVDFKRVL